MCRTQVYLDSVDEVIVVTSHQSKGFKTSCHLEVRGQTETGILYWFLFRLLHVKSPDCWSSESRSFSSVDVCNFPTLCSSFCFSWTSDLPRWNITTSLSVFVLRVIFFSWKPSLCEPCSSCFVSAPLKITLGSVLTLKNLCTRSTPFNCRDVPRWPHSGGVSEQRGWRVNTGK